MSVLAILYVILGYWATGKTIFANKVIIHSFGALFVARVVLGAALGVVLIPIAILRTILHI